MATQKDGGLVSRAVREALGTLVSPQVYGQLLTRSLQASGLTEIPEGGRALAQWVKGALHREIETSVGEDAAELVAEQLAPIVAHASMSARSPAPRAPTPKPPSNKPKRRSSQPRRDAFASEQPTGLVRAPKGSDLVRTARVKLTREQMHALRGEPVDPGHTSRPQAPDAQQHAGQELVRVLAASTWTDAVDALKGYLAGTAEVVHVSDLVNLLDIIEAGGLGEPVLLLDCLRPTVHVTSIAAIGADLPRGTTIVLWGASDDLWQQLDKERTPACRWVRCSSEATTDDVGSLCSMLIGTGRH